MIIIAGLHVALTEIQLYWYSCITIGNTKKCENTLCLYALFKYLLHLAKYTLRTHDHCFYIIQMVLLNKSHIKRHGEINCINIHLYNAIVLIYTIF